MKQKKILLPVLLAAILFGVLYPMKHGAKNNTLKISLMGFFSDEIAPENISQISLYHLNVNLWGTLLTSDGSPAIGTLTGVSKDNLVYTFEISESAKFSNGRKITAEDIVFSIERIIAKEKNGHVNARGLVDSVAALSVNQVSIHLKDQTPAFLFLLSTPEFAIVPKEACDDRTNDIVNPRFTSGAYTVDSIDKETEASSRFSAFRGRAFLSAEKRWEIQRRQ